MRKIISAIIALTIILSSLSALMFTSSAESENFTVTEYGTEANECTVIDTSTLPSANRLSGTPLYYSYNATSGTLKTTCDANTQSSAFLYDGNLKNQWNNPVRDGYRYYNGLTTATDGTVLSATNCRFVLNMGKVYDIDTFLVAGSYNQMPITSFEIYVADDKDTIFNTANKVASYTRDSGSKAHQYLVKLDKAVNAKYFAVKILEVDTTIAIAPTDKAIYLNELGAYGVPSNTVSNQSSIGEVNLLLNSTPCKIISPDGTEKADPTVGAESGSLKTWTNGKITDMQRIYNATKATSGAKDGMKIAYELGNYLNVSKVALSSGNASYYYVAKWEVYASNSVDDLFDASNCYAYVENTTGTAKSQQIDVAVLKKSVDCKYIGIKILEDSDSTQTYAAISEIAVIGGDAFSKEPPVEIGKMLADNVIYKSAQAGNTVKTYVKQGIYNDTALNDRTTLGCHGSTGSVDVLYDNKLDNTNRKFVNIATTHTDKNYYTMQIVFDAGQEYTVDSALLKIAGKESAVSYIAFVGDSKDTIFQTKNILAISENENGLYSGYVTVDSEYAKTGSVFGIMLTGYTGNASLYPDEIAFFEHIDIGVKSEKLTEPYGVNILKDKKLYQGTGTTVGTTIKEQDGYSQSVSLLTNGLFDDANIAANGGNGLRFYNGLTSNFVYDMEDQIDIAKVIIAGGIKTSGDNTMAIGSYGIFVGNDTANLFDTSNRVAFVLNEDYSQIQGFDLSSLDVSGRYIGILIYGLYNHYRADDSLETGVYFTEIGVYGNISTDKYTVENEPSNDSLAILGTNAIAPVENSLLTDGIALTDDSTKANEYENAAGKKLTYNMGAQMNITSLLVGSLYNSINNVAPRQYRIYLSNDADTLYDDANLVINYYNLLYKANSGNYAGSTQLFKLATSQTAQYVGFEFVETALNETSIYISELAAFATYDMTEKLTGSITSPDKVYLDGVLVAESANVPAELLKGNHSLVVEKDGVNNVYIVNDGVFTRKSTLENAISTVGTQIRTDDPLAIRFVNEITVAAKAEVIKYGTVVAKTAALNHKDLIIDSNDYATLNAVAYEKGVSDIIFAQNSTTISFTAAIHNIAANQYLTYYAVRPYAVVKIGDVEYTIYGKTSQHCVADVAETALADSSANYGEKVMTYLNGIKNNSSLADVSKALYTSYGLTDDSVAASVKNAAADNNRLIKVIQKAMNGEEITLGVLGGSITMGANVIKEDRYAKSYSGRLREWLENTFNTKVNLVNAGIGATTSTFGVHRIEKDLLQHDPDLVILEYAVNETESDTTNKTYEDCVRRILAHQNADGSVPALILLFTVRYSTVSETMLDRITAWDSNPVVGEATYYNNQGAQMIIGNNYNLPMISYMDCIVPLINNDKLTWSGSSNKAANLTTDNIHPSYFGHQIISSLLSDYIANVAKDVTNSTSATIGSLQDALYGATYTNAKFYNSVDLPEEWITSMGSFKAVHNICNEYIDYEILTHGWKAYSTDEEQPMVLNIPGAKSITLLVVRTKKIADGIKMMTTVTEEGAIVAQKIASNYLNSSNYADTTVVYTADVGKDLTVEIAPNFNGKEGEAVLLGIMVGFDE